ncbi:uncharacterized protein LOC135487895 [Lineus longissimus]|uniref:uncharacterized protein LOC135487895 n=1 Tax=Lineus longissimus TaxID=88925 RepID=UPI00315D1E10
MTCDVPSLDHNMSDANRRPRLYRKDNFAKGLDLLDTTMTKPTRRRQSDDDDGQERPLFTDLPKTKPELEIGALSEDGMTPRDIVTPPILIEDTSIKAGPRRGSLSGFLHRKMAGLQQKFFSGNEPSRLNPKSKYLLGSCPNLVMGIQTLKPKARNCRSSDGRVIKTAPSPEGSNENIGSQEKLVGLTSLTVPDVFVTSKTHSRNITSEDIRVQSSSSPDLGGRDPKRQAELKQQQFQKNKSQSLSVVIFECLESDSKGYFKDANISEILDFLYMGNIESVYNEHLLCRLGVDRVVDLSNKRPDEVPSKKKSICPCTCPSKHVHSRAKLCISVEDIEEEGIDIYFREINVFLEGARKMNKKVLVASYLGKSRCAVVTIQYLMAFHGMHLRRAYNWVKTRRDCIQINPGFQTILEQLEEQFYPGTMKSMQFKDLVGNELARRTAWTET